MSRTDDAVRSTTRAHAAAALPCALAVLALLAGCNTLREAEPFAGESDDDLVIDLSSDLGDADDVPDDTDTSPPDAPQDTRPDMLPSGYCGDGSCLDNSSGREDESTCCIDCGCPDVTQYTCQDELSPPQCLCEGAGVAPRACGTSADGLPEACCPGLGCVVLAEDERACGECGDACGAGESCSEGECVCGDTGAACGDGTQCCSGTCVAPDSPLCSCGGAPCALSCCGDPETGDCVDFGSDPANCGACGVVCAANEVCNGGNCDCAPGYGECDAAAPGCETHLESDATRCGTCGTACDGGEVCQGGQCFCIAASAVCPGTQACCAAGCVDASADAQNCGSCGNVCSGGRLCANGGCECDGGLFDCGTGCVDRATSAAHCGGCGNNCGAHANVASSACNGGSCLYTCASGFADCAAADGCETNTTNNPSHCGSCGNACGANAACSASSCVCNTSFLNCDNNFAANGCEVNRTNNPSHCGACGNVCGANATCAASACACVAGRGNCDGNFASNGCEVDTTTSNTHCGACGNACPAHQRCSGGTCSLGNWHFSTVLWVSPTVMLSVYGTATFNGTSFSTSSRNSAGATTTSTGSLTIAGDNHLTLSESGATYDGQLSRRGDVLVLTHQVTNGTRLQSVWVRKGSGHTTANLAGSWYVDGFLDLNMGADPANPYSFFGDFTFTSGGAMSVNIALTTGATDTSTTGTASVAADGAVTITTNTGAVWSGQLNEHNDVVVLQTDPNGAPTDGSRPGHFVLVRKGSGLGNGAVSGTYYLNHLTSTNNVVWGEAVANIGAFAGGWLATIAGGSFQVCAGGSITVGATGSLSEELVNGAGNCNLTSMLTGWAGSLNGGLADVLVQRSATPTTPSLQVWLRKP